MAIALSALVCLSQTTPGSPSGAGAEVPSFYKLGPGDQISIQVPDAEEFTNKLFRVEQSGDLSLPYIGRVHSAGLTVAQLEELLVARLRKDLVEPRVSITVTDAQSHPVLLMGAVERAGVVQLGQKRNLIDVLALAGGLRPEVGPVLTVSRPLASGPIPIGGSGLDGAGKTYLARIPIAPLMNGTAPELNIEMLPNDSVTVPRAEMIYIVGEVEHSGSFAIGESGRMSVLQALALAGGVKRPAATPNRTTILRENAVGEKRTEIPVDLTKLMANKLADVELRPRDIVFVPSSTGKRAALRALEIALQTGSGMAVLGLR